MTLVVVRLTFGKVQRPCFIYFCNSCQCPSFATSTFSSRQFAKMPKMCKTGDVCSITSGVCSITSGVCSITSGVCSITSGVCSTANGVYSTGCKCSTTSDVCSITTRCMFYN